VNTGWLSDVVERWPVPASDVIVKSNIVTVRRDTVRMPDGQDAERDVVEHPGAVAVLAIDDADRVLLIRQYRHPVGRLLWEIPAGLRDVPGEPLVETAQRELLEEAGYLASDWHVLADIFTSPGFSNERLRVFLATNLTHVPDAERDYVPNHEEAYLKIEWAPLDVVVSRFLAGELHNGVTAVGVLAAYVARQGGFAALRGTDAPER
jgi:8-oxo-dGTP pyrophosphatase MutT (NUDIX family)